MDRADIDSVKEEIFIDFSERPEGESKIIVKSVLKNNPELDKKIKEVDEDHLNVLSIFIDTASRDRIWRKYPRMSQFLASAKHDPDFVANVYEHKLFFSIAGWTIPNIVASVYGASQRVVTKESKYSAEPNMNYKNMKSAWSLAQENGYITGRSSDYCSINPWDRSKVEDIEYLRYEDVNSPHHLFYQMACEENLFPKIRPYNAVTGPYGYKHRCFFRRDASEVQLDYVQQFWKLYPKKRKFYLVGLVSGHNLTGESHRYIDIELEKMFNNFLNDDENNIFKDTIINIYSDHGDHIAFPLITTKSGKVNKHSPFFFQIIPKSYVNRNGGKRDKILRTNENRMMTHFDLFKMYERLFQPFGDLEEKFYVKKGVDLINEEVSLNRTIY